jgi:hypothetical protein
MKDQLIQLNDGTESTLSELIENEPHTNMKSKTHYILFNAAAIIVVVIVALICPKCSDADDRALGLPPEALEGGAK